MDKYKLILILSLTVSSCTYDNIEEYYNDTCDTLNVTYAGTVSPILDINCIGCHNSSFSNGGIIMEEYSEVKTLADNGKLLGVIDHQTGFKQMPPAPAPKLDNCSISKIKKWIDEGAQNN